MTTPKSEIVDVPARPCLILSAKVSMPEMPAFLRGAYGKLYGYAGPRTAPRECFARYRSWTEDSCEVEAGVITKDLLEVGEGEIRADKLGGHRALHAMHRGPYAQIGPVYEAIQNEMKSKELKAAGPPYEIYYNDPNQVLESELLTGVYWPIE
ncbi:MAG TPA: GyrI-like domain-containing protein [Fimbriimonadaceae bacterium]|nr:GyrI-like domain-containing protein [Fimbriimonadaceae bacterium]